MTTAEDFWVMYVGLALVGVSAAFGFGVLTGRARWVAWAVMALAAAFALPPTWRLLKIVWMG